MFLKFFKKANPPDDLQLVQQYRVTGDMDCLGELFERHTEMVYLVCLKYLHDEDNSKDATMQVFESLTELLLKHEISNFKSWLHVITKNHCLMQLRAKKGQEQVRLEDASPPFMENADLFHLSDAELQEQSEQQLRQGLETLPPEQRTCVELFYLQQKSYKEIAEQTNFDLNKVKSYIQNGKRNLKLYLEKHHEPR
ncbi:RNA polymerase sigma factor [Pontibacter burrus]|uniref:Sigma-70 family RNA polymerase sigma factor n=1 Tax=Pontibacter burrus TaxID=2704466 RepID=A0A6B3LVW3_9BACT|nr:sigma-70 family RNA polymerase sigma factor [Pontibacter burrus]NEM97637.1 sigma-70 family RNA polymerase sigma factor [Pontibacter burrus]